jgi:hypothetical protein
MEAAGYGVEKCERLLANPDFLWFVELAITKPREDAEKTLKDTTTERDAREIAAHVRDAMETAEQFVAKQRDIYSRDAPKPEIGT